ncbi:MAG: DUF1273 family protein [Ruminococcaceae bacterium]|nr:DUF1273 family protein [Oscillospiraceae bacterium]
MHDKAKTCCFFGHRKIPDKDKIKAVLCDVVENLILNRGITTFLFGSNSEFDDLCHEVVTKLKEKYQHIQRIYVRAEFPYIDEDFKNYLLGSYEDTYHPESVINAGRAAYPKRNRIMIDSSSFCVVYYDENYTPQKRKVSKNDLTDYQPKSGTKIAYEYATKKGAEIINTSQKIKKAVII